ncbi:hypothetical protein BDW71DRAFT_189314 [Aspergillus fruticulosus]
MLALPCSSPRRPVDPTGTYYILCVTPFPTSNTPYHPLSPPSPITTHHLETPYATTMRPLLNLLLTILIFPLLISANFTPCVNQCISDNDSPSWCQGNEIGRKATQCLCRHLDPTPLIECIRNCNASDQWDFAGELPQNCRDDLFPDAREGEGGSSGADKVNLGSGLDLRVFGGWGVAVVIFLAS